MSDFKTDFYSRWATYARQAGSVLGVDPNTIIAQWAFESDYGRSKAAKELENVAGINVPGSQTGTDYRGFKTQQDFTDAYIQVMKHPGYTASRNTGSDVMAFVKGLQSTPGHYYFTGNQADYIRGVSQIAATNPMGMITAQNEEEEEEAPMTLAAWRQFCNELIGLLTRLRS